MEKVTGKLITDYKLGDITFHKGSPFTTNRDKLEKLQAAGIVETPKAKPASGN